MVVGVQQELEEHRFPIHVFKGIRSKLLSFCLGRKVPFWGGGVQLKFVELFLWRKMSTLSKGVRGKVAHQKITMETICLTDGSTDHVKMEAGARGWGRMLLCQCKVKGARNQPEPPGD